jgi:hypothetical protein
MEEKQTGFFSLEAKGEVLRGVDNTIARHKPTCENSIRGILVLSPGADATMDTEYIFFNHFVGRVDEQKHNL